MHCNMRLFVKYIDSRLFKKTILNLKSNVTRMVGTGLIMRISLSQSEQSFGLIIFHWIETQMLIRHVCTVYWAACFLFSNKFQFKFGALKVLWFVMEVFGF